MNVMKKYHLQRLPEIVQKEENAKYIYESILLVCMGSRFHQRRPMETSPVQMMINSEE